MAESSPLSYQTTMPDYPDVSYKAWVRNYGLGNGVTLAGGDVGNNFGRLGHSVVAWVKGAPAYETWRTNLLDEYNAAMSAYNTWLNTGEGVRASAESGRYNPSYFSNGAASASPLNYGSAPESSGFDEMAQGVSGIIQFAMALQSLRLQSAQIRGIDLKNQRQAIENGLVGTIAKYKADKLGYEADWLNMRNTQELYSRYRSIPELWKNGVFSPFGTMTYDLRNVDQGLGYQKAAQDLEFLRAGTFLRQQQKEMLGWNTKQQQFYFESMQDLERIILENQGKILKGQFDFQPIEQKLRKRAVNFGVGLGVVNAALNTAKLFIPGRGIISAPSSSGSPSWGNFPFQSHTLNDGFDVLNGNYYPWYR